MCSQSHNFQGTELQFSSRQLCPRTTELNFTPLRHFTGIFEFNYSESFLTSQKAKSLVLLLIKIILRSFNYMPYSDQIRLLKSFCGEDTRLKCIKHTKGVGSKFHLCGTKNLAVGGSSAWWPVPWFGISVEKQKRINWRSPFSLRFYLFIFKERGKVGERGREMLTCERNISWLPLTWPPTRDLAHNPGMCPDWDLNWWPLGSQCSIHWATPARTQLTLSKK